MTSSSKCDISVLALLIHLTFIKGKRHTHAGKDNMKKKTVALLITSAVIFSLAGCAGASTETASVNETAIESSSEEGASAEETSSVEANEDVSTDVEDDSFTYNGETISILNDASVTLSKLGTYDPTSSTGDDYKDYVYNNGAIEFSTNKIDGIEAPVFLYINTPDIKTARGVGVGSTQKEIIDAYGDPDDKKDDGEMHTTEYHFDTYTITFRFSSIDKEKVDMVMYTHNYYHSKTAFS